MNRGIDRQRIFHTVGNGETFLDLLARGREDTGVEIHAYCLMPNHFHLLLHCPDGGLSTFMQRIGAEYTRIVNRRLGGDGPIFRSRFRSLLVDSDAYVATVGRYIHRNPLDLGRTVDLATYRWSSFKYDCGLVEAPPWLTLSLAATHGGPGRYRSYVEGGHAAANTTPTSIRWAIGAAIAELDTERSDRPNVARTVALLLLDLVDDGAVVAQIDDLLGCSPSPTRLRARRRARARSIEEPWLTDAASRALALTV